MINIKGTYHSPSLNLQAGYQYNTVTRVASLISIRRDLVDVSDLISSAIEEKLLKEIKLSQK